MKHGTCKHYNGSFHNTHCDAGVCYLEVTPDPDDITGIHFRHPCFVRTPEQVAELNDGQRECYKRRGTCDKFEEPTDAEIAEEEAAFEKFADRFLLTLPLIQEIKESHKGHDWKGSEPCPECGGTLHLSHAAYNGHVWGQCETEGCLSWME